MIRSGNHHRAFRFPTADLIRKHMSFLPLKTTHWLDFEDVGEYGPYQSIVDSH